MSSKNPNFNYTGSASSVGIGLAEESVLGAIPYQTWPTPVNIQAFTPVDTAQGYEYEFAFPEYTERLGNFTLYIQDHGVGTKLGGIENYLFFDYINAVPPADTAIQKSFIYDGTLVDVVRLLNSARIDTSIEFSFVSPNRIMLKTVAEVDVEFAEIIMILPLTIKPVITETTAPVNGTNATAVWVTATTAVVGSTRTVTLVNGQVLTFHDVSGNLLAPVPQDNRFTHNYYFTGDFVTKMAQIVPGVYSNAGGNTTLTTQTNTITAIGVNGTPIAVTLTPAVTGTVGVYEVDTAGLELHSFEIGLNGGANTFLLSHNTAITFDNKVIKIRNDNLEKGTGIVNGLVTDSVDTFWAKFVAVWNEIHPSHPASYTPGTLTINTMKDLLGEIMLSYSSTLPNIISLTETRAPVVFSLEMTGTSLNQLPVVINQPVWITDNGVDYQYWIVGNSPDKTLYYVESDIGDNTPKTGVSLKILPTFEAVCYKDGGIQSTPETVENSCLTVGGQSGTKIRTRNTLAITMNSQLNLSETTKLLMESGLRNTTTEGGAYILGTVTLTNLGLAGGVYNYSLSGSGLSFTKGQIIMLSQTPNKEVNLRPFLITQNGGTAFFSHPKSFSTTTFTGGTVFVMSHLRNGTTVKSFSMTQINNAVGLHLLSKGCVTKSMEISSPAGDVVNFNLGIDSCGGFVSNPTLDDPQPYPFYSQLTKGSTPQAFTGSNSIVYLDSKVFPVSEFTLSTGDLTSVEFSSNSEDNFRSNSAEYPTILNQNSFNGVSGTMKGFLSKDVILILEKFNSNCQGSLLLRATSVPICDDDGVYQYNEFIIHLPKVTITATIANPAMNAATVVDLAFSCGYSPDYNYTLAFNWLQGVK